jgi:hypothetical protein
MYSISKKLEFIESIFGKGVLSANGKNFSVRCPICAPSDINKKKLAIRTTDDAHHCWVCGWKSYSLAPLIRKYGTSDQLQTYRSVYKPDPKSSTEIVDDTPKVTPLPQDFTLLAELQDSKSPDARAAWNYLTSRSVTLRDAWHYRLGISGDSRWKRRVIMPSYDEEGTLNFYVARNFDTFDRRPKYDNPDDDKYGVVFNEINIDWGKRLVICEGPFDLVKCGDNSTALLGSDFSPKSRLFSQIMMHGTPIALALDGDMWHKKTPKIAKLLSQFDVDVQIVDTRGIIDPGSSSKKEFKSLLEKAVSPTWENLFFDKLNSI